MAADSVAVKTPPTTPTTTMMMAARAQMDFPNCFRNFLKLNLSPFGYLRFLEMM